MDVTEKLTLLGGAARYEVVSEGRTRQGLSGPGAALCAGESARNGTGTLLRVLQSSYCEHDCAYCPLRRSNDPRRAALEPDELARATDDLARRGKVDGLLLSSAVDASADRAMDRMLDTLRLLRGKYQYQGYIHLKVLPGVSLGGIDEAALLADRLSLNIEVPDGSWLAGLETGKRWHEDIMAPLTRLRDLDRAGAIRSGITSQLLIGVAAPGAAAPTDRVLATGGRQLSREFGLRRMHFGSFSPAQGTPLADIPAPDPRRRARLYQWDWLATHYEFGDAELEAAFDARDNLPLGLDPKLAVSLARPGERPVEVNTASYEDLLRVPGIGPVSARRILELRRVGAFRELRDLKAMGVAAGRAAPFVLLDGRRPPEAAPALRRLRAALRETGPRPVQLPLWPDLL